MALRLRGRLTAQFDSKGDDSNSRNKNSDKIFWFENESNKKSSFVFNESSLSPSSTGQRIAIEKPCHLFLECCHVTDDDVKSTNSDASAATAFLFGGLEIHSNSRNIEVYALGEERKDDNSFDYLKTCRGTMIIDNDSSGDDVTSGIASDKGQNMSTTSDNLPQELWEKELYRTIVIPPNSKPIPILKLHLKLLSLRPAKCTVGYIKLVKLKGRLPDVMTTSKSQPETPHSHGTSLSPPPSIQNQNHTQNDQTILANESFNNQTSQITNAISAITVLIQNTQQTMEKSISTSVGEIQKLTFQQSQHFHNTLQSLERNINEVNNNLNYLRKEVHALIKEQKDNDKSIDDDNIGESAADENNDEKDSELIESNQDVNDKLKSEESVNNVKSFVKDYLDKMQERNRREMEQLLIEERKILLNEMDRKRDELINEVTKKLTNKELEMVHNTCDGDGDGDDDDDDDDDSRDKEKAILRSSPIISLSPPASPKFISLSPPTSPINNPELGVISAPKIEDKEASS